MDPVKTEVQAQPNSQAADVEPKLSAHEILRRSGESNAPQPKGAEDSKTINLDDIKDPDARAFAERRIKELESGYNKKFEEVAKTRKELESQMAQANQPWTPNRIQSLLKDQNFLSSVQELQRSQAPTEWSGSDEEWSSLSPREKQEFDTLRRENMSTRQQVNQLLQSQEDVKLKEQFPNYDANIVNELQRGLLDGTIQATRADLWKVANYESDIERVYQLGMRDAKQGVTDKLNAGHRFTEMNVKSSESDIPEEVRKQGISSILKWRMNNPK